MTLAHATNLKPVLWNYSPHLTHPMFRSLRVGLVAHWVMWEGGGVPSDIGPDIHPTTAPTADPTWGIGPDGRITTYVAASSQFYRVVHVSGNSLDITGDKLTIWARVRSSTASSGNREFFIGKIPGAATSGYSINRERVGDGNTVRFIIGTGSAQVLTNAITGSWTDFHDFAGVYDGANIFIYQDGIELNKAAVTGNITSATQHFEIGAVGDGTIEWNGDIDQVRVYDRTLSVSELRLLKAYPYGDITPWWDFPAIFGSAAAAAGIAILRRRIEEA